MSSSQKPLSASSNSHTGDGSRPSAKAEVASSSQSISTASSPASALDSMQNLSITPGSSPETERKKSGFLSMRSRTSSGASLKSLKNSKSGTSTPVSAGTPLKSADGRVLDMNNKKAASSTPSLNSLEENAEELPPAVTGKKWKPRPGHPGNLSSEQATALLTLTGHLSADGTLPPEDAFTSDQLEIILCRFLRARQWSVEKAREMWNKSVEWKKSVNLEKLMKDFDFEERDKVAKAGWQMYFHKTDKLGRPLFVQDLAYLDPNALWTITTPDRIIQKFAVTLEGAVRYRYAACTQATDDGRSITDNLMIVDIAGLGMSTFWAFKGQLQQLLSILDNNFPELSGRVQIINAPWLFSTIWSYLKGWLPPNTVDKIDIQGADYKNTLLQFIDAENLPKRLGGTCECIGKGGCTQSDEGPWKSYRPAKASAAAK